MKKILGIDLGTTSIGWALVNEKEKETEKSSIEKVGVRIIPLSSDEVSDFNKGNSITTNANRTLKRGARRNLDRYQLRRQELKKLLIEHYIIDEQTLLTNTEGEGQCPYAIWELRFKAATEKIELQDFARVLFAINKKRGYKSSRKTKDDDDGQAIDGMDLAKRLFEENISPGQLMLERLNEDKKGIPDFYRSDLQKEFDLIWDNQKKYHALLLSDDLKNELFEKAKNATFKICEKPFNLVGIKRNKNAKELTLQNYQWRVKGLSEKLDLEQLTIVLQEINGQITNSSGYLGKISDRSKDLYFNKLTVGQYLFKQINENKHNRLKGQVFYRQDYLDEFEIVWEKQAQFYKQLNPELKSKIRDVVIFYQRRLKSQKGLISVCELEGIEKIVNKDGKSKLVVIGPKACPKSSLLFQEFKIWQKLNDLEFKNIITKEKRTPELEFKELLFEELNVRDKLSVLQVLKFTNLKAKDGWEINFKNGLDGNLTNAALYAKFKQIAEISGHEVDWSKQSAKQTKASLTDVFSTLGIDAQILQFNTDLEGKAFTQQPAYQFWHLLYSYEGDESKTGDEKLIVKLQESFGFEKEYAKLVSSVVFKDDYGSLSTKAMLKMIPHLKAGHDYYASAKLAGFNHSKSLTKEENDNRPLKDVLELLPKNSLRNPVVEKILNQLVNVVNAIIEETGSAPDEIRVELARELKKGAKERQEMTKSIAKATANHESIRRELQNLHPFSSGVRITKKDIIKYKLWQELKDNGYKTIYTNTYVSKEQLFSKEFDIEHIIPKARIYDDSFSNKTLSVRSFNGKKGNKTGVDSVEKILGEQEKQKYLDRVENLFAKKAISKSKYLKLKMTKKEIPDEFINRDLRNTQYISKKATELLSKICKEVHTTSGSITDRLRQDWQLISVMKELNWEKYNKLGLVEYQITKDKKQIGVIKDWSKRSDHRHHIMDAITVAFTKPKHIQYLNFLNSREDQEHKKHYIIKAIEENETILKETKRVVKPPMCLDELRVSVKHHLENTLVSFKAKNKVTTQKENKTKRNGKLHKQNTLTPRGQLHKETVYGKKKKYVSKEEKVNKSFDAAKIALVAKNKYKNALLNRLNEFGGDPKKAFTAKNTLDKNPVYLDDLGVDKVPEKVKLVWQETFYTIRKEVGPDLKIDKVVDLAVKRVLQERLDANDGDPKKAFINLEEKPIWLNEEKGISLKRVTTTGVSNALALHYKKDHLGQLILDENQEPIATDFVSTGNNHHVAIYEDKDGSLQEKVVSFFEAVERVKQGQFVVDKSYNSYLGWKFLFTLKQNEMFVFPNNETGFDPKTIDLKDEKNYAKISPNLFRVQKISSKNYFFRHHLETSVEENKMLKEIAFKNLKSLPHLNGVVKIRLNHLGKIVKVGEY